MSRQIAIIGRCDNTRGKAPIGDDDWEIWGLARDPLIKADRLYEIHEFWTDPGHARAWGFSDEDYIRWLAHSDVPVVLGKAHELVPDALVFPADEIRDLLGESNATDVSRKNPRRSCQPYVESSLAAMVAHAIWEHSQGQTVAKIGLWGIDLDSASEYAYQRPNMEYLLGFARGMGIKVYVPKESHLMRSFWTVGRYGIRKNNSDADMRPEGSRRAA